MAIGKPLPRIDGPAKVSGRARYTDDFRMPGERVAKYFRSTIAHGRVTAINTEKARDLPGVDAVFTYEDVPQIKFATAGHPYSLDPDHKDLEDRLLLTGHVRYMGDEIAVVVAEDEVMADRALALIEVEYEEYKALVTPEAVSEPGAVEIHRGSGNLVGEHSFTHGGDYNTAQKASDVFLKERLSTQIQQHCHLENHTALAYMEDMDRVVVISSTQIPHITRRIVGQALGIPLSKVKVIKPYIGGGFGNKQDVVLEPMVAFCSMKLGGAPVRFCLSREECMIGTRVRHPFQGDIELGVTKDGKVELIDVDVISLTGAYASHGHSVAAAGTAKVSYMYPGAVSRCRARTFYSNAPASGAMRAYGSPQMTWIIDCTMENAARAIGMDSLEFRLLNVAKQGDPANRMSSNPVYTCGLEDCLKKAGEYIGWKEKRAAWPKEQNGPVRRGLGVACFSYASGTYPVCVEAGSARLILNQDATVTLQVGATEIGQGSDTAFAQMAAETLGFDDADVHVVSAQDTDVAPFDTGAYASRQTYVSGKAVFRAASKLRRTILMYASEMTEHHAASLDISDGYIVLKSMPAEKLMTLKELALDSYYNKDRGGQLTAEDSYKTRTNAPSFGCTAVDLEVDIPLCKVKINKIINVHDSGVIINPLNAMGQVHGGMAMGIGAALFEELMVDEKTGRIYNNNLLDYKVPTMMDLPDLAADFVATDEPTGAYGSKSLGEPPVLSPPPAIRNAILDATGVAVNSLPLGPRQLFNHFKAAGLFEKVREDV